MQPRDQPAAVLWRNGSCRRAITAGARRRTPGRRARRRSESGGTQRSLFSREGLGIHKQRGRTETRVLRHSSSNSLYKPTRSKIQVKEFSWRSMYCRRVPYLHMVESFLVFCFKLTSSSSQRETEFMRKTRVNSTTCTNKTRTPSPSPPLMGSWGASACGRPDAPEQQYQQADDQGPTIKAQADQEARRERPGWKASERGPGGS